MLSPSDCAAVGYVINKSEYQIVHVYFCECDFSTAGAMALLQQVGDRPFSVTIE